MNNNQDYNLSMSGPTDSSVKTFWIEKVTVLLENLFYPSESDEPVEWFSFQTNLVPPLTAGDLKFFQGFPPDLLAEEIPYEDFWQPLILDEDWFGDIEKAQLQQSLDLRQLLDSHLLHQQAFRIGIMEVDLFLIGQVVDNEWFGLKTKLIET